MKKDHCSPRIPWELFLFSMLYIIMPEYLAIEFSASLPLITASRMVLILLGIVTVIRQRGELLDLRHFNVCKWKFLLTQDPYLRWGMIGYFALLIITNASFLTQMPSAAIKELLSIIAEQYGLVWLLVLAVDTREKIKKCLQALLYASAITAVVAILGVLWSANPFHLLKTTQRDMLMTEYYRMGILRAEAGFGHPVFYGAFCTIMIPIGMHFLEESEKRCEKWIFSACITLNAVAMLLSNSRGSQVALVVLLILMLPIKLLMGMGFKRLLQYGLIAVLVLGLVTGVKAILQPDIWQFDGQMTSQDQDLPGESESGDNVSRVEYGENEQGLQSRLVQLSGIEWTLKHKPLFGFGAGAHNRRELKYEFSEGYWRATGSVDVGIVAIIGQFGLMGMAGFLLLYTAVVIALIRRKMWKDKLMLLFFFCFAGIMLCLLSVASMDRTMWFLIGLFVCLVNAKDKEDHTQAQV